jgi:hypothetical protein
LNDCCFGLPWLLFRELLVEEEEEEAPAVVEEESNDAVSRRATLLLSLLLLGLDPLFVFFWLLCVCLLLCKAPPDGVFRDERRTCVGGGEGSTSGAF